eukprot:g3370.t1
MGPYLSKPITAKFSEDSSCPKTKLQVGASCMQGWRRNQEDAHLAKTAINNGSSPTKELISIFGVFDGHGGAEVSLYTEKYLTEALLNCDAYSKGNFADALIQSFHEIDRRLGGFNVVPELENLAKQAKLKESMHGNSSSGQGASQGADGSKGGELEQQYKMLYQQILQRAKLKNEQMNNQLQDDNDDDQNDMDVDESSATGMVAGKSLNGGSTQGEGLNGKAKDNDAKTVDDGKNMQTAGVSSSSDVSSSSSSVSSTNASDSTTGLVSGLDQTHQPERRTEEKPWDGEDGQIYVITDNSLTCQLAESHVTAGCTACVCLLCGKKLYCANAGDSRAVLCRNGKTIPLSYDHKPNQVIENSRIRRAGGFVKLVNGHYRINGNLNLSRSIGDLKYKQTSHMGVAHQMITAQPDVRVFNITPEDDFFIIACDGVWDIMSNEEAVAFVKKRLDEGETVLSKIAEEIFDYCITDNPSETCGKGGDNMTCIIVKLK